MLLLLTVELGLGLMTLVFRHLLDQYVLYAIILFIKQKDKRKKRQSCLHDLKNEKGKGWGEPVRGIFSISMYV